MVNKICPGFINFNPADLETNFACGGNILDIKTRLVPSIPASLRANSKLVRRSSWTPFPLVRNNFLATKSNNSFLDEMALLFIL